MAQEPMQKRRQKKKLLRARGAGLVQGNNLIQIQEDWCKYKHRDGETQNLNRYKQENFLGQIRNIIFNPTLNQEAVGN